MSRRGLQSNNRPQNVKREKDPIPWRYCFLTLVCGLILVVGFFWAARQHFSAMDYGIKNAKLRQQKEGLEADQRRLFLTKEVALSPAELQKAAQKIGLQELSSRDMEVIMAEKAPEKEAETTTPVARPEQKPQMTFLGQPQQAKSETVKPAPAPAKDVKKEEPAKTLEKKETEKPKAEVKFSKDGKASPQPAAKINTKEVKK